MFSLTPVLELLGMPPNDYPFSSYYSLRFHSKYNWTIVLPAELNAAAVLIGYWNNTTKYVTLRSSLFECWRTVINESVCITASLFGLPSA